MGGGPMVMMLGMENQGKPAEAILYVSVEVN
jgi:hypothetical protein